MEIFSRFINKLNPKEGAYVPKKQYPNLAPLKRDTLSLSGNSPEKNKQDTEIKPPIEEIKEVKYEPLTGENLEKLHASLMETVNQIEDEELKKDAVKTVSRVDNPDKAELFLELLKYKQNTDTKNSILQLWISMSADHIRSARDTKVAKKIIELATQHSDANLFSKTSSIMYSLRSQNDSMYDISDSSNHKQRTDIALDVLSLENFHKSPKFFSNSFNKIVSNLYEDTTETHKLKIDLLKMIASHEELYLDEEFTQRTMDLFIGSNSPKQVKGKMKMLSSFLEMEDYKTNPKFKEQALILMHYANSEEQANVLKTILTSEQELYKNADFMEKFTDIVYSVQTPAQEKLAQKFLSTPDFYENNIFMKSVNSIISSVESDDEADAKIKFIDEILLPKSKEDEDYKNHFADLISYIKTDKDFKHVKQIVFNKDITVLPNQLALHLENPNLVPIDVVDKLNKNIGIDNTKQLSKEDTTTAIEYISLLGVENINEIPLSQKRNLLRKFVASNTGLFSNSEVMHKHFPLLPQNQEEYCTMLPALVRSLGIETKELSQAQITEFNSSLLELGDVLKQMNDSSFNNLNITQEYPKEDFIKDVLKEINGLDEIEQRKVFDYYGFELKPQNIDGKEFYSIYGYPVNINNGEKLAQITDPKTREVIEALRENVIYFSEENYISCSNPKVEMYLNEIVEILPELRTTIGRTQSRSHYYDVMTHSLKVIRKIAEQPDFKKLNESDKKILLLSALLHDITKAEGRTDATHPIEGSFDSFFIAKKFNLTKDEEIKLYTIIKHHEWLSKINTATTKETRQKQINDTAYDLRHDNLFELSLIFTHADLKSIGKDDSFHTKRDGDGRTNFEGITRSFGEAAEVYAKDVRNGIEELKKSQPLLPITKVPKADEIASKLTRNPDGTTNIKGVYINEKGLVIIKYNEVEDFEAIGFHKGSFSKGIKTTTDNEVDVDTGNMKFIAHGLDYPNQLAKFDAFGLIDSDALLSVSYMERPESKYRLFRPQGLLLDVDTKYIHGGGNTDMGSGCGKDVQNFKDNYIFGAHREQDRLYISELIKQATGMSDEEYIDFVSQNQNKSFAEIEPKETREAIIKIFASINSNKRRGNREYNEMYVSNPSPIAVFAYDTREISNIGNPIEFLNSEEIKYKDGRRDKDISNLERTEFLQKYAIEHNLPFIIFGD